MEGRRKQVHFSKRTIRTICQVMTILMVLAMIPAIAPQRAQAAPTESSDFLMYISEVSANPEMGTMVTGSIIEGSVNAGDKVLFAGRTDTGAVSNFSVTIKGLEKSMAGVESAQKGDTVTVLIGNVSTDLIRIGDALISDNNSPYVNHQGIICGSLKANGEGYGFDPNEKVTLFNKYAAIKSEIVGYVYAYPENDEQNTEIYFKNPSRAHVYRIGEKFNVMLGSKKVATLTVTKVVSTAAQASLLSEKERIRTKATPIDLSAFSDPYPNYAWFPWEEDGKVFARSGNNGRKNTNSSLVYKPNFSVETTICFRYKAKTEGNGDKWTVYVDGDPYVYGTEYSSWGYGEVNLSPGSHTLIWEYIKDGTELEEDDYFAVGDLCAYESLPIILDANGGYYLPYGSAQKTEYMTYWQYYYFSFVEEPLRKGYTFRGYSESPDYRERKQSCLEWPYYSGDYSHEYTIKTYYAVWEKNEYNVLRDLDFLSGTNWKLINSNGNSVDWQYLTDGFISAQLTDRVWTYPYGPGYEETGFDDWAVSPAIELGDMKYTLRFRALNNKMLSVYVGTSPDTSKMKKLADYRDKEVEELTDFTVPLDGYENKTVYIAFRHYNPKDQAGGPEEYTKQLGIETVRVVEEFSDVRAGSNNGQDTYFYEPVYWAKENGITMGVMGKDGVYRTFNPTGNCTRAQMVTFLWRMADCPEPTKLTNYPDVDKNTYYYKAVCWAQETGITEGYPDGTFKPQNPCDRKQAVTFLWRFAGKPIESQISNFPDVEPGTYYYDAVNWAATYEITTGYPDGTFKPTNKCSRSQMVTFLYRYDYVPQG